MDRARLLWAGLVCLLCAGCAGYRLGPTGGQVAGARGLRVPFARNATVEPRLTQPLTEALRRQVQLDGTFRLETGSNPTDLVLDATIVDYDRRPMAFRRSDVISVQEYELHVTVRVVLRDPVADRVLLDRPVQGRTALLAGADQSAAERQAAPLLVEDVARRAIILVAEGEW
jgi:hypothetical protein